MPIPFGVGIGDCLAGIDRIIEVVKACRDVGGASDEYKSLAEDLRNFVSTLENLKEHATTHHLVHDSSDWSRIMDAVGSCEKLADDFHKKLSPYDRRLGNHSQDPYMSTMNQHIDKVPGFVTKAKFALLMPDEVRYFHKNFATKIRILQLLITSSLNTSIMIQIQQGENIQSILSKIENTIRNGHRENVDSAQNLLLSQALLQESLSQVVPALRQEGAHTKFSDSSKGFAISETHLRQSPDFVYKTRLAVIRTLFGCFEYCQVEGRKRSTGRQKYDANRGCTLRFIPSFWFLSYGLEATHLHGIAKSASWKCTLTPLRNKLWEDDQTLTYFGITFGDNDWKFDPDSVDLYEVRRYLESGEYHPSDYVRKDGFPEYQARRYFLEARRYLESGKLYSPDYITEDGFSEYQTLLEIVCDILPPKFANFVLYRNYFKGLHEVLKLLLQYQEQSNPQLSMSPLIGLGNHIDGGFAEICIEYSPKDLLLAAGIHKLNSGNDTNFLLADLVMLFRSQAQSQNLSIFQNEYIKHLEPDDILRLTKFEKCLMILLCNFVPGFEALLVEQMRSYGSTSIVQDILSQARFKEVLNSLDNQWSLLDTVVCHGTVPMLEFLARTEVGDLLACNSGVVSRPFCFNLGFDRIPEPNRRYLSERGTKFGSRYDVVWTLHHNDLTLCSWILDHCQSLDQQSILAEYVCINPVCANREDETKTKAVIDTCITKLCATEDLKFELLVCMLRASSMVDPNLEPHRRLDNARKECLSGSVPHLISLVGIDAEIVIDSVPQSGFDFEPPLLFVLMSLNTLTPLMIAVFCADIRAVEWLIKAGAQIKRRNSKGISALELSRSYLRIQQQRNVPYVKRYVDTNNPTPTGYTFYMNPVPCHKTDERIYEILKNAAKDQSGEDEFQEIDMIPPHLSFSAELIPESMSSTINIIGIERGKAVLSKFRVLCRKYASSFGFDKLTIAEVLVFRIAIVVLFAISIIYHLYSVLSDIKSIRLPAIRHTWLLVSLLAGVVVVQELWGLYT